MKTMIALFGLAALAACSGADNAEDEPAASEEAAVAEAGSTWAGTYQATTEEGQTWTATLNPDGTYRDEMDGEVLESGSWAEVGEQVCFYPEVEAGAEAEENCFTAGAEREDGTFEVTDDDGTTVTITKIG